MSNEDVIRRVLEKAREVAEAAREALSGEWPDRKRTKPAEAAVSCWRIAMDHCVSMVKLCDDREPVSAWSLMKSTIEAQLKGYWALATDEDVVTGPDAEQQSHKDVGKILYRGRMPEWTKNLDEAKQVEVRSIKEGLDTKVHKNLIEATGSEQPTVRKVLSTMTHGGPIVWNMVCSKEGWETNSLPTFWKLYPAAFGATATAHLVAVTMRELDPNGVQTPARQEIYQPIAQEWQRMWDELLGKE